MCLNKVLIQDLPGVENSNSKTAFVSFATTLPFLHKLVFITSLSSTRVLSNSDLTVTWSSSVTDRELGFSVWTED
jgi:hypothetical protein